MNVFSTANKDSVKKTIHLTLGVLVFSLLFSNALLFADTNGTDEHGKPLDVVLQEIRDKQGLGPDEAIDPRTVSDGDLEELGEAVMSIMIPDPRQRLDFLFCEYLHQFIDNFPAVFAVISNGVGHTIVYVAPQDEFSHIV